MCVTFVTLTNGCGYASDGWQGRQRARVPPPPLRAERRLGYPQANFFYFFRANFFYFLFSTPSHNIIHLPIFFPSERFSLLLCVFPLYVYLFVSLRAKNGYFYPIHSLVCFVVGYSCVFSFVLLSVLCFCVVFCCGCCVFRLFAHSFALCGAFFAFACNYSS